MKTQPLSNRSRLRSFTGLIFALPVAAMVLGIVACLPVPVGDPEKSVVDKDLLGAWISSEGDSDKKNLYVVHAFDKRSYVVKMYGYKVDDDGTILARSSSTLKGWLSKFGGKQFICLDIINDEAAAGLGKKEKFYIVGRVEKKAGQIAFKMTNPESDLYKGVKTSAQAEAVLAKHADNPKAFLKEDVILKRIGKSDAKLIKSVLRAFHVE